MDGVDTVILGVKNREELLNTIQAAKQPLTAEQIEAIDALDLRKLATCLHKLNKNLSFFAPQCSRNFSRILCDLSELLEITTC